LVVDRAGWRREIEDIGAYLAEFGERVPAALVAEQRRVAAALSD
jgi:phosphoenolpyruvate carboxykinase (GTP)